MFGVSVRRKNGYNPGSAGSEFGERTGIILVRQVCSSEKGKCLSPNSEPWQVRSSPGVKKLGQTLVPQVRSSEKGQFLSPNSEPWQARSWRKDTAEPWFGRFGVRRTELQRKEKNEKKKKKGRKKKKEKEKNRIKLKQKKKKRK